MRKLLVAVALLFVAVPSFSALQYEFVQTNTSDDAVTPSRDLNGRATVDGARSRVDFIGGTLYPPGTYMVTNDGSRRLFFVDPTKKWYTEVNTSGVATALGASKIKIGNLKSEVTQLDDHPVFAGIAADHFRLTMTYDITVTLRTIPVTQHVSTEIDSWTTSKFGDIQAAAISGGFRTGNEELDQLIATENNKITGFPLRQVVTIHTQYDVPNGSKLSTAGSRTITRETLVTSVQETKATPGLFTVPVTYRRADLPDLPRSASDVLNFEPKSN